MEWVGGEVKVGGFLGKWLNGFMAAWLYGYMGFIGYDFIFRKMKSL